MHQQYLLEISREQSEFRNLVLLFVHVTCGIEKR